MPKVIQDLNRVNRGPFGSEVTNFVLVRKVGADFDSAGIRDFVARDEVAVDGDTMFGEGSIGKIRYAGLAYMMQQEGIIDLKSNAGKFFATEGMGNFLERKYPGQGAALQAEIAKFFTGESASATIADLTTHMAGIGDLTRDQARLLAKEGVEHNYTVPDLLLLPKECRGVPRDKAGKPRAQSHPDVEDQFLPEARYGVQQYSNLGYLLLGLALEGAYASRNPAAEIKNYKQLTREFMLHPIEGKAVGRGLEFKDTKFPEEITARDNVARTSWYEKGVLADTTKFSGANAGGGIFTSANDSVKFFEEFFRGFPGTAEYGIPGVNKFFTTQTIGMMWNECLTHSVANQLDIDKAIREGKNPPNRRYQGPGFCVDVDVEGKPLAYVKGGETNGYASFLSFNPQTGKVDISMSARENVTNAIAKECGLTTQDMISQYSVDGKFDRKKMILEKKAQLFDVDFYLKDIEIAIENSDQEMAKDAFEAAQEAGLKVHQKIIAQRKIDEAFGVDKEVEVIR